MNEYIKKGWKLKTIANAMHRSYYSIRIRAMKIKNIENGFTNKIKSRKRFPIKFWTDDENEKLKEMLKNGNSIKSIANELGRTSHAIECRIGWLKKKGIELLKV